MTVYLLNSYNIDDPEMFRGYPPKVAKILPRYGARVLAADTDAKALEGTVRNMNAIIEFPSEEAVRAGYNDPESGGDAATTSFRFGLLDDHREAVRRTS
jgi:uncharacterized protein (DUF1330 family)